MGKKTYRLLEEHIIKMFETDRLFNYYGKLCEVIEAGKPRPQGGKGECKTDVFVRSKVQDTAEEVVLKISVKLEQRISWEQTKRRDYGSLFRSRLEAYSHRSKFFN